METMIDKFGRVVIPKNMRKHLGLEPGSILEIEERGEQLILKPIHTTESLRYENGVLVFTGKATGDLQHSVAEHRKSRIKKIFGDD